MSNNTIDRLDLTAVRKRPVAVTSLAWLYVAIGTTALVYYARELLTGHQSAYQGGAIELTELLAITSGVFMLQGRNWARSLAVAWIAFHVLLSAFHPLSELVIHSFLLALITWLLFRPSARLYFRPDPARSD